MRRTWIAVAAVLAVVVVAATIAITTGYGPRRILDLLRPTSSDAAAAVPTADVSGTGPGSLLSATTMPDVTRSRLGHALQAARVVYRSTNGDTGAPTVVSGTVFIPSDPPPDGGWPVVGLAHGTTGIQEPCAPSLSDTLLGQLELVAGFVNKGYAVALADYQGLGSEGVHPYTDARTAGYNVIDSVRALRHTFGNVSNKWAAFGGSQGGGAAWAADEQARTYAPDLQLVGAVAYSPAADVTGMVDKAAAGTLTFDQRPAYQAILYALAALHPDLNLDDYRRGAAAEYWDILASCSGPKVRDRGAAIAALGPLDLQPATPAAADRIRELLRHWALPQQPLSAPLSVVYGGQDTYIDAQWTTDAIARACALGGTLVWNLQPDKGHGDVEVVSQFTWMADRFAGKPVTNQCPEAASR
jgi:alpha-beta hydrolase superfamily lysophospholipase